MSTSTAHVRGTSATDGEPILHLALLAAWRGDHAEASRLVIEAEERATDDPQAMAAARTYELLIGRALGRPNPTFVIDVERHLDEVVAAFGWRSDNTPFLWPAGVDAALADGDLDGGRAPPRPARRPRSGSPAPVRVRLRPSDTSAPRRRAVR